MAELEARGGIEPWAGLDAELSIIPKGLHIEPGSIQSRCACPHVGATELTLSNGMRVRPRSVCTLAKEIFCTV